VLRKMRDVGSNDSWKTWRKMKTLTLLKPARPKTLMLDNQVKETQLKMTTTMNRMMMIMMMKEMKEMRMKIQMILNAKMTL